MCSVRTLTGLLSAPQAVSRGAHAGAGGGRRGQTQLRAVTIVVTAHV